MFTSVIGVVIKALLALVDAPDFNSVIYEPFHDKRCFLGASANAVIHEHQQNIEFTQLGVLLYKLNLVTVAGADLEAGNAVFLFFADDFLAPAFGKFSAGYALHENVGLHLFIEVYLLCC